MGQKIFAVATDVLEAFAARTRMLIFYIMICVSQNECFANKRKKVLLMNEWKKLDGFEAVVTLLNAYEKCEKFL